MSLVITVVRSYLPVTTTTTTTTTTATSTNTNTTITICVCIICTSIQLCMWGVGAGIVE